MNNNDLTANDYRIELEKTAHKINELEDKIASTTNRPDIIRMLGEYETLCHEYYTLMDRITESERKEWKKTPLLRRIFRKN